MMKTKQNTSFINYAHRGASAYAPENTMAAFRQAVVLGASGIELDLQKTKDGKIVIFHDDTIDKKSNGSGKIADHTYNELLTLDFGSWFSAEYKNEKIVLFEDFMKWVANKDLTLAIELKQKNIEAQVLAIIKKYRTDNLFITSFMYDALAEIRQLDDSIKIGWLIEEDINQSNLAKLNKIAGNQICPPAELVSQTGIKLARACQRSVRLWGVKDTEIMRKVYNLDIDGMTVNFPDQLNKLLGNRGKLYVLRHGQTNCNKEHRYNCRYDEDINATGVAQALAASNQVKEMAIDLIICSPLKRTRHTADLINVNHLPIIYDERIIEREGGKLTKTIIDDYYYQEYYNYYSTKPVAGLETLPQVFKRVHAFLDEIKAKYKQQNILLVTHGTVARVIQFYFEKMPADGMLFQVSGQKNCEIKEYTW